MELLSKSNTTMIFGIAITAFAVALGVAYAPELKSTINGAKRKVTK